MKLWRVIFPIFLGYWVSIFFTSFSAFSQKRDSLIASKKLDSIRHYYDLSNSDSLPLEKRLSHVSLFLDRAIQYDVDSLVYKGFMQKTWLLGKAKYYDSAIVYTKRLNDFANRKGDTAYIQRALTKLGFYYKKNNQFNEAFRHYNENFKICRIIGDSLNAGKNLLQMANIQTSLGDYSGSKTTAIDGVFYSENSKDLRSLAGLYHIISVANRVQKNYSEAIKYNERAIALGTDSISQRKIGRKNILIFKNTKALILANQNNYSQAIEILRELEGDSLVVKDRNEYARVLSNLGHVQWLKGDRNKTSEELLLKALRIQEEIPDRQSSIMSNIYLSQLYFQLNKIEKALYHAESAYKISEEQHSLALLLEALGLVFKLKEDTKNEAIVYDKIHKKIQEINQNNREIYAVTRYENDKLTTENLVLKAETAKKERQRIIYLFGSILIVLIAGSVFYMVQQRHKRQIIRNVYDAEARISKKLHDELANDVYNVMIQIQNDQSRKEVLDKLEDIYNSTRDISRENSSFNEVRDFHLELSNMLSSYSADYTKIIIKDVGEINWQSITPEKKIIVYRILQELMINMKKHSEASLVAITFKKEQKNIKITYADNGVGVDKDEIIYSSGLRNAENRIKTIGGSFIFDSEMERGFKATVHFPN